MPLVATWTEADELFGAERGLLPHVLRARRRERAGVLPVRRPRRPGAFKTQINFAPFRHIALSVDQDTQDGIKKRLADAGYRSRRPSCWTTGTACRCT